MSEESTATTNLYACSCGWQGSDVVEHGTFMCCPKCLLPATFGSGRTQAPIIDETSPSNAGPG